MVKVYSAYCSSYPFRLIYYNNFFIHVVFHCYIRFLVSVSLPFLVSNKIYKIWYIFIGSLTINYDVFKKTASIGTWAHLAFWQIKWIIRIEISKLSHHILSSCGYHCLVEVMSIRVHKFEKKGHNDLILFVYVDKLQIH